MTESSTPPYKRVKLEAVSPKLEVVSPTLDEVELAAELQGDEDEDHCAICLQSINDRTVVPTCSHEFCFECLMVWSEQSRRCPLCSQNIGDYLIHRIRSTYDYQKHFLPPLRTSPRPITRPAGARVAPAHRRRDRAWGPRDRAAQDEADALDRAVSRRRWIYHHELYAKHVASNKHTRYRPYPSPAQFTASQDLISRMTVFLRRELLVWPNLDVEFLVTFVISLMKSIDIRSESAIKLLAEFLDMDTQYYPGGRFVNSEHFAHEIYCYLRSPYRDLATYDSIVQYDIPQGVPPPPTFERMRRWESAPSRSPSPNFQQVDQQSRSPPRRTRDVRRERSPGAGQLRSAPQEPSRQRSLTSHHHRSGHRGRQGGPAQDDGGELLASRLSRSRSPSRSKGKGKQRALSRSPSPSSEADVRCDPRARRSNRRTSLMTSKVSARQSYPPARNPDDREGGAAVPHKRAHSDMCRSGSEDPLPHVPSGASSSSALHDVHGRFELDRRVEGSPQSRNGRSAQEHVTQIQPVDGVSLLPGGRLPSPPVASSNTTPELSKSTDLPIPHDDRARTSLTREPRHRSLRDSIGAHLRASSAKAEKSVPRTSGPPLVAHIAAPEPAARSEDTGFVVDVNEQQTEDPSRLSAPVIMAHTRARLARARAERDSTPFADVLAPGEDSATASAEDTGPVPRASRTRLLRRLDTERSTAAEMRLRTQAHLRTRLAGERQLATQDRVGGGGGGDVDKGARSARELGGVVHLVPDDAAPEDPGREAALRARLRGRAS